MSTIRVGIVGLGANCRLRHVPGLLACPDVQIVGVVNRRSESTQSAAKEFAIPNTYDRWQDLVSDEDIDAIVIGTWPYLHCEITLAALEAGKHVLSEARMAMNAHEAHRMLEASEANPNLITQIVPSPLGFRAHHAVKRMLSEGYIGELREVTVIGIDDAYADEESHLVWRQSSKYSGHNTLILGIIHETLVRWVPDPVSVFAQTQTFTPERADAETGEPVRVGTPDSVHVLTQLPDGARGIYHLSGALRFGPSTQIHLYGADGTIKYLLAPEDRLLAGRKGDNALVEVDVPPDEEYGWRVEQDFVEAIRGQRSVDLNDFATGVRYMEFTEAVARSAQTRSVVDLPLPRV